MEYGTLAEKKDLQRKSGYYAGGALLFAFLTAFAIPLVASSGGGTANLFTMLLLVTRLLAAIPWVIGCCYYARSKGWSAAMGVLGILTCLGLLVLVLLPDKWAKALKTNPVGPSGPPDLTNYPR